ncbi:hypothetical protein CXF82_02190 [Shewanella sp. GutDb-MelDb]|jgi:uncharacterized lipoprotein NlpE involved in copper resistance|nr:hypothetical protein CXF82_02190 [Shewanella sp. GutDb-MelDb]PKG73483.1 hypothetical protein CXF86_17375 [Shewanella sp. GutCb]
MRIFLLLIILVLCGCESSQDMFRTQSNEGEVVDLGIRCEMVARTGSNRKTKVCRTAEQLANDEAVAERSMERMQKTGVTVGN